MEGPSSITGIVFGLSLALAALVLPGSASAGGMTQPAGTGAAAAQPAKPVAPQTASLVTVPTADAWDSVDSSDQKLNLGIDPFKTALAGSNTSEIADPQAPPPDPAGSGSEDGAKFEPMLHSMKSIQDNSSHTSFIDQHAFGIELRSDF